MSEADTKSKEGAEGKDKDQAAGTIKLPYVSIPVPRFFKALDGILAFPLEGLLEEWQRKRKENIDRQFRVYSELTPDLSTVDEIDVGVARLLNQWLPNGSAFGEEEPDLAAAWTAVLDRILKKDRYADAIMKALDQLPSADLREIVDIVRKMGRGNPRKFIPGVERSFNRCSHDMIFRMQSCGLIRDKSVNQLRFSSLFTAILFFVTAAIIVFTLTRPPDWSYVGAIFAVIVLLPTILSILFIIVALVYRQFSRRYLLTEIGKRFVSSYVKYSNF